VRHHRARRIRPGTPRNSEGYPSPEFHGFGADVPPSDRWRQLATEKLAELDALVARPSAYGGR